MRYGFPHGTSRISQSSCATTTDPDTPQGVTMMFECGNVRALNHGDASLFSIPATFTKES
jgi:hypothetical protein